MARHRNVEWNLPGSDFDKSVNNDVVKQALLMDIREELRTLNLVFKCHNALAIPGLLRAIDKNTRKTPMVRCRYASRYKGKHEPTCDQGRGCRACRRVWRAAQKERRKRA